MKNILLLSLISLLALNAAAQQLDPLDFIYDHETDVLQPAEVLEHHVASCTVSKTEGLDKTVIYDGNGRVVANDFKRYFHIYDHLGNITVTHVFHFNDHVGQFAYEYDESGNLITIKREVDGSYGTNGGQVDMKYENGRLVEATEATINISMFGSTGKSLTYEYGYDENGEVSAMKKHGKLFAGSGDESDEVSFYEGFLFEDGIYTGGIWQMFHFREATLNEDGLVQKVMETNSMADPPEDPELIEEFSYYPNGLVKSRTTPEEVLQYEYEYLSPATVNINVPEGFPQVRIFNYSQYYDMKIYDINGGTATIELYVPYRELYAAQLTEEFQQPFLVEPGQNIELTITNESISFAETDHENNFIVQIEGAIRSALAQDSDDGGRSMLDMIVGAVQQYPELMCFLFYTSIWDVQNQKQLFLDYATKMLELYPNNFKAHEMYSIMSK